MTDEPAPTPPRGASLPAGDSHDPDARTQRRPVGHQPRPRPWPYPSFRDPDWLGADTSSDPALLSLVAAVRRQAEHAYLSGDPTTAPAEPAERAAQAALDAMNRLTDLTDRAGWALLALIGEARANGATWVSIGHALGVTKQAARQRFGDYVEEAMRRADRPDDPHPGT